LDGGCEITTPTKTRLFARAIIFVSKDENLTRSHVRHLEVLLTERIMEAGRTLGLDILRPITVLQRPPVPAIVTRAQPKPIEPCAGS
jgi:hypothetical protein